MKRSIKWRQIRFLFIILLSYALFFVSCGVPVPDLGVHKAAIRPTASSGINGYGTAPAKSYLSKGGGFKVWWATSGPHVPVLTDKNNNGIPDIVELAAETADEVKKFVESKGFHIALQDDKLFTESAKYGGDARFDIYFLNFPAGDGKYNGEACITVGSVKQCGGYLVLENDYAGTNYGSIREAIRIVLPHEYFHAIQSSYKYGMPGWWSEGSATWFEEFFNPSQHDFEHLASLYFREPSRTLSDRQRGPSDSFAYGASLFVYFLSERFSPQIIRLILEEQAKGSEILKALEIVFATKKTTLGKVFEEFATYNIFTGMRSAKKYGYTDAMRFATVPIKYLGSDKQLNWNVDVDPLAARYGQFDLTRPMVIKAASIKSFEPATLIAASLKEFKNSGKVHIVKPDQPVTFTKEDSPIYLAVVNGKLLKNHAIQVQLRYAKKPHPTEEKPLIEKPELEQTQGDAGNSENIKPTPEKKNEEIPEKSTTTEVTNGGGCGCNSMGDLNSSQGGLLIGFLLLLGLFFRAKKES